MTEELKIHERPPIGEPYVPPAKVQKVEKPAYTLNVNNALDKEFETRSFKEICELPPSCLQGIAAASDEKFGHLKIRTIRDLGEWKYYRLAKAIQALSETEEEGKRNAEGNSNINAGLIKEYETKSLKEILQAPPSALSGLSAEWVDEELQKNIRPHVTTIEELANWKYCRWAEAFVTLAEFENADHSSR
mmetsp:Transcript_38054/g.65261  ORF Transcript_38054/g.65261 Transcript_38054/m.65261 type:complete len:190 (-) Transcript_38054:47-616(-)